jgi:hypothetical protein
MRDADYIADKLTSRDVKPEQVQNEISVRSCCFVYSGIAIPLPVTSCV